MSTPQPLSRREQVRIDRAELQARVYRWAQDGTLGEPLARDFPIAAQGGDINRDYRNHALGVLKNALLTVLALAACLGFVYAVMWLRFR